MIYEHLSFIKLNTYLSISVFRQFLIVFNFVVCFIEEDFFNYFYFF